MEVNTGWKNEPENFGQPFHFFELKYRFPVRLRLYVVVNVRIQLEDSRVSGHLEGGIEVSCYFTFEMDEPRHNAYENFQEKLEIYVVENHIEQTMLHLSIGLVIAYEKIYESIKHDYDVKNKELMKGCFLNKLVVADPHGSCKYPNNEH